MEDALRKNEEMTRKTNADDGEETSNTTASNRAGAPSEVTDKQPREGTRISNPPLHWHHVEAMTGSRTDAEDIKNELSQYLESERDLDFELKEHAFEREHVVEDPKGLFGVYRCWRLSSVHPETYGSLYERTPRIEVDVWHELMSIGHLEMHLQSESEVDIRGLPVVYGPKLEPRVTGTILETTDACVDDPIPEEELSSDELPEGETYKGLIWNLEPFPQRYLSKKLETDPQMVKVKIRSGEMKYPANLLWINPEPDDLQGFLSESECTQFLDEITKSCFEAGSGITRRLRDDDRVTVVTE